MHLALLLAFITFFGWGTGDLFTIYAARKIGAPLTALWIFIFGFALSLLVLPFAPHNFGAITMTLLLINLVLGIFFVVGNILVTEAYRISSAPLIGVIVPSFPAVVLLLSALVYHDKITPLQILFILIILIGVTLCSINVKEFKKNKKLFDRGTILALIGIGFFSIFFTFSRVLINTYGWFLPTFIAMACFPITFFFLKVKREKFRFPKNPRILLAMFMVAFLIRAGDFAFNYGLTLPNASGIVAPIANSAPMLFVIASYFIYRDKISKQQIVGIVITLVGILLTSLT